MVQMKASVTVKRRKKISLYIPHGSDERKMRLMDMNNHDLLYIPHGSDESLCDMLMKFPKTIFISHMVQMKVATHMKKKILKKKTLYPTWFR